MALSPDEFTLDSKLFNQDLYESILQLWLPSYPEQSSRFSYTDILRWFSQSDSVDKQVKDIAGRAVASIGPEYLGLPPFESYEEDREQAAKIAAPFLHWVQGTDLNSALAIVILLDQFPRNLFRSDKQSIVYVHYDRLARAVAGLVPQSSHEAAASPIWRYWFLLPLEHSEYLKYHIELGTTLWRMLSVAKEKEDTMGSKFTEKAVEFADKHLEPIQRFSRFPWRNKWLGRESSEEEKKWLEDRSNKFGSSS